MTKTRHKALISAACLCILGAGMLAGCGIKPGSVSPPEGVNEERFPRTYPDTHYDPAPALPPSPR